MTGTKKILLGVGGSLVVFGVLAVAAGVWWFASMYDSEQSDPGHAASVFAQVRARFAGTPPAFEIRDDRLVVARTAASSSPATAVHMLVWMPGDRTLSRVRLPFAISMVATEPLPLEALAGIAHQGFGALTDAKRRGQELNIRISDLERYGSTLLLDGVTPDGKHVLMWSE